MRSTQQRVEREEVLDRAPLVVIEEAAGQTTLARYLHAAAGRPLAASVELVAIVASPLLAAGETVGVVRAAWEGPIAAIDVHVRRHEGDRIANDPAVVLVEVALGPLSPGSYQVVVTETTRHSRDASHAEESAPPETRVRRLGFVVAG
jgi:hypothetical protein